MNTLTTLEWSNITALSPLTTSEQSSIIYKFGVFPGILAIFGLVIVPSLLCCAWITYRFCKRKYEQKDMSIRQIFVTSPPLKLSITSTISATRSIDSALFSFLKN
ncbi:unnamed protein product [Didymodactylos carnosus]|uniref:Uncharacterized protein n=1 Tax=Didymodactylos carnosus TaxID=1234261 RepID=A0A814AXX1_9BILA|nr:unnamed protein product [Didymodactylos carnosus]CAF0921629.1 unnamed protein product [Didymodactylos carnosus]CAF3582980.1 unnamed protein product [Didymodactylos carnosus]CAF3700852.1 unnamed protein product [Didymodactylos carnosus]